VRHTITLLLELGLILTALSVLGAAARRLSLSPVPLYLLAGLALGEGDIAPVPAAGEFVETGAAIGVVLLLLTLGLQFSLPEFTGSMRRHAPSAAVDLVLNAAPGAVAGWLLGLDAIGILALAGATYVSSSGIVARLLADLRRLGNRETPAILSVLVMEDIAMAAYLPLLAVLASGGAWWQALLGVLGAVGAVLAAFAASYRWGHHLGRLLSHPDDEQLMLRVLGLTLSVAALAELVHVSAAVGAFLVGLCLTGETADRARAVLRPLRVCSPPSSSSPSDCRWTRTTSCRSFPPLSRWPRSRPRPNWSPAGTPRRGTASGTAVGCGPEPRSSCAASSPSSSSDWPARCTVTSPPWSPPTC
jgi:CPA2 family monovalent cation:H+ antiporter-2